MNKEKLSKTISLLMHQNLCVVNNGTKEKPDFVVGGTELLNKELTKLFSLYGVSMQSEPFVSLIEWIKNHKHSEKLYRETPECIVKYYLKEINGY